MHETGRWSRDHSVLNRVLLHLSIAEVMRSATICRTFHGMVASNSLWELLFQRDAPRVVQMLVVTAMVRASMLDGANPTMSRFLTMLDEQQHVLLGQKILNTLPSVSMGAVNPLQVLDPNSIDHLLPCDDGSPNYKYPMKLVVHPADIARLRSFLPPGYVRDIVLQQKYPHRGWISLGLRIPSQALRQLKLLLRGLKHLLGGAIAREAPDSIHTFWWSMYARTTGMFPARFEAVLLAEHWRTLGRWVDTSAMVPLEAVGEIQATMQSLFRKAVVASLDLGVVDPTVKRLIDEGNRRYLELESQAQAAMRAPVLPTVDGLRPVEITPVKSAHIDATKAAHEKVVRTAKSLEEQGKFRTYQPDLHGAIALYELHRKRMTAITVRREADMKAIRSTIVVVGVFVFATGVWLLEAVLGSAAGSLNEAPLAASVDVPPPPSDIQTSLGIKWLSMVLLFAFRLFLRMMRSMFATPADCREGRAVMPLPIAAYDLFSEMLFGTWGCFLTFYINPFREIFYWCVGGLLLLAFLMWVAEHAVPIVKGRRPREAMRKEIAIVLGKLALGVLLFQIPYIELLSTGAVRWLLLFDRATGRGLSPALTSTTSWPRHSQLHVTWFLLSISIFTAIRTTMLAQLWQENIRYLSPRIAWSEIHQGLEGLSSLPYELRCRQIDTLWMTQHRVQSVSEQHKLKYGVVLAFLEELIASSFMVSMYMDGTSTFLNTVMWRLGTSLALQGTQVFVLKKLKLKL